MHLLISFLIPLLAGFWVYVDAKERGRTDGQAFLWALGTFLALIIFLPLWFYIRWRDDKEKKILHCMSCKRSFKDIPWASYCPYCGSKIEDTERSVEIEEKKDKDNMFEH